MNIIEKALLIAESAHKDQKYDIFPYIYHVKEVKYVAESLGYDTSIIVAAILHDTIEDSDLSFNDIKKAFGEEIAEIVYCVTDELGRNRKERKEKTYPKIKRNWKATIVKICDRYVNVKHSKEYNPKMFEMYKKEHNKFYSELFSYNHPVNEVDKAWKLLDVLFND